MRAVRIQPKATGLAVVAVGVISALVLFYARSRLILVRVEGLSMMPTLRPGERVIAHRYRGNEIMRGTIVVLRYAPLAALARRPPRLDANDGGIVDNTRWVIKRVAAVAGDLIPDSVLPATGGVNIVPEGRLVVLGDSTRSLDSRQWGLVSTDLVLGVVI